MITDERAKYLVSLCKKYYSGEAQSECMRYISLEILDAFKSNELKEYDPEYLKKLAAYHEMMDRRIAEEDEEINGGVFEP